MTYKRSRVVLLVAVGFLAGAAACRHDSSYAGQSADEWAMLLRDGDSSQRMSAATAFLHEPPAERAHVFAVLRARLDRNASIRAVVDSVVTHLPDGALKTIVDAIDDPDVALRRGAARALGHYRNDDDDEIRALIQATRDPDDSVRTLALYSLGDRSAAARAALSRIRELATTPGPQRAAALEVLPNVDTESRSLMSIYLPAVTDTNAAVRAIGVQMLLAAGGGPQVIPLVARALDDPDAHVRAVAARVLAAEAHHDSSAYSALVLRATSADSVVRRLADSVKTVLGARP
jgi:HEAT repeat protein